MSDSRSGIPQPELRIIVVDPSKSTNEIASILKGFNAVSRVQVADTLPDGMESLRADDINTIFIDPLEFDLEQACSFIFRIRRVIPQIVFVICSKRSLVEANRAIFFQGERSRLSHYFFLDKETPTGWIDAEIEAIIGRCIYAHRWIRTLNDVDTLRDGLLEGDALSPGTSEYVRLIDDARGQLMALLPYKGHPKRAVPLDEDSVFVSYSFQEENYGSALKQLLLGAGFAPVTGEQTSGYIGRSVIERIRQSRYFLSLITRVGEKTDGTFTCSPWLLEEKGVALAFDKRIVMLVEDGVTDYGLMQGDWERIHFDTKSFSVAAIRAINQIKSYRGDG
jgi:hypothetical protein